MAVPDIAERETIEEMFRETGGVRVTTRGDETWGHYAVEPQVELDGMVLDDVPTLTIPQGVEGVRVDDELEVDGVGLFFVRSRVPASAPGEVTLVLQEVS